VRAVSDGRYKYLKNYMPEKPYYQDIEYRLGQQSMKEILRLRDEGKLNEKQMYWFRKSKPKEELFDTKTDPNEYLNLVNNPKYQAKLVELRKKHQEWLNKYGDLGAIPEKELLAKWWNGKDKAPQTNPPLISTQRNKVSINCTNKGASIGYKKHWNDKSWEVYSKPFNVSNDDSLYVLTHRIGYLPSQIVKMKVSF
jgi:hypothetical protein